MEIHADVPHGWLKLQVAGTEALDLNGMVVEVTSDKRVSRVFEVQSDACLRVPPGATVVLGITSAPDAFPAELNALITLAGPRLPRGPGVLTLRADGKPVAEAKVP